MKKKNIYKYILAFLIPMVILVLFCISRKIGIFGKYSLLISDFQAQYIVLLKHLREGGSILYSLSKGMGGGMIGTFAYYLSSPLNLLIYLFPKDQIILASIVLIILKISLCGFTMYLYLSNHFKTTRKIHLAFSTCYALMAYIVNYHFHIMWLDGVMLLPLVMMGIDKLFEKKSVLYIVSLFLAILSNYYIGYMICIMCVLYFIGNLFIHYSLRENKKEIISHVIRFFITSLLAGFLTMVLMIPNVLELQNGYKSVSSIVDYSGFNLSFLEFWSRTYMNSHNADTLLAENVISIYCGLIVLPLMYFFFVNKKIEKKEKIIYGILFLTIISGYFINAIGMIFHGFNTTNCYNYRFSFLASFIMILIACKSFDKIKEIPLYHYLIFIIFYLIMSNIMILLDYNYLSIMTIIISCVLVGVYLFLLYQFDRYTKNNDLKILLFVIVCSEVLFNLFMSLEKFEYYQTKEFDYYYQNVGSKLKEIQDNNPEYRISTQVFSTYNDGLLMEYNGISAFLSTVDVKHLIFLRNAGYFHTGMASVDYDNNSIVMDSLLGIKHRISSKNKDGYNNIGEIKYPIFSGLLFHEDILANATIYENPYALPLGYMISSDYDEKNEIENVLEFQNYLLNTMLGNDKKYFKTYKKDKLSEGAYEFTIDNDGYVYLYYFFEAGINECTVLVNGQPLTTRSEVVVYNKDLNGNKLRISLDGKVSSYGEAYAYYFDKEEFKKDIIKLQENKMTFEKVNDGYIKGKVVATNEFNRLFLSVPYEKGWNLYVDGKETEIDIMYDSFMGVTLKEGEHVIEFKYETPGLKLGSCVSIVSLLSTIGYLYMEKNKKKVK